MEGMCAKGSKVLCQPCGGKFFLSNIGIGEDRAREKILGGRARERTPFGLLVVNGDGQNISEKENKGVREFLCP